MRVSEPVVGKRKFESPAKFGRELKCYKFPVQFGKELKKQHAAQVVVTHCDRVIPLGTLHVLNGCAPFHLFSVVCTTASQYCILNIRWE